MSRVAAIVCCFTWSVACGGGGGDDGDPDAPPTPPPDAPGLFVIAPRDVMVEVVDATAPTTAFSATLDGVDVTGQVTWTFDRPDVATFTGAMLVPAGNGGRGTVTGRLGARSDATTASIHVTRTLDPEGLAPSFGAPAGPDPAIFIVYPTNGTVFPRNVVAPEIQLTGAGQDAFRFRFVETYYDYTVYATMSPPVRFLLADSDWSAIARSGTGPQSDPLAVTVQRRSGGTTYEPLSQTWHVAQADLPGTIYYTEIPDQCGAGNPKTSGSTIDATLPTTAAEPSAPCRSCHTISRDGRRLVIAVETAGAQFAFEVLDLTTTPATTVLPTSPTFIGTFGTFDPTGSRLIIAAAAFQPRTLALADAATGAILNADLLPGQSCGEPAWSPDGARIAAICGLSNNGGWVFDENVGDLVVADIDATGAVTSPVTLVPAVGGNGRPAYPSFSSDSAWITYGRPTQGSRSVGSGDLWIVPADGGASPVPLDVASVANGASNAFYPTFAPVRAGGYHWIAFASRRDYGSRLIGWNRQQVWITAISDPPGTSDPSHPAFYVRGQNECTKNEQPMFARSPCAAAAVTCTTGIDCCSGQCVAGTCGTIGNGECASVGNACQGAGDCCDGVACTDGWCQPAAPL